MRKFTIAVTILLASTTAFAVDLQDALTSAYDNNYDLKAIRRKFLDEIEQFPQALSGFMPRISASVDSQTSRSKAKSQYVSPEQNSTEQKSLQKGIQIEQPIFNGGGSVASLKAAQSSFRASRGKYYDQEQKVILGAIKTYLECYEAKEKFNISEISLKSIQTQLDAVEERLKLGEATETDLATARAVLAAAETNKLTAYANFQATNSNFIKVFGIEPADITMPALPDNLPSSLDELVQKSQANPETENMRHTTQAAKANEAATKADLLPQVSFKVQAGRNYYDQESRNPLSDKQNSMSTTSILSVRIPIYAQGGAEYSRIRKAKNQTRLAAIQLDSQIKSVKSNCTAYWEGFNAARSKIAAASKGVHAAQIAYEGMVQEELVGSKTILDVLDAEDKLHKAMVSNVEANKDYILNAYQIKALVGQLTAKSLKLKTNYFSPETEFKKIKARIIGF